MVQGNLVKHLKVSKYYETDCRYWRQELFCLIRFPTELHQFHHNRKSVGCIESRDDCVNNQYLKRRSSIVRTGCCRIKELGNRAKESVQEKIFAGERNFALFRQRFCRLLKAKSLVHD